MTSILDELADRVELAGPCRETDGEIALSLGWTLRPLNEVWLACDDEDTRSIWIMPNAPTYVSEGREWIDSGYYDFNGPPRYTASLDAAMTLARTPQEAYQATRDAMSAIAKRDDLHCCFYKGSLIDDLARQVSTILIRARSASESSHGG